MKLYYSPGACSLSPHITLREAELPFELVRVDTKTKKTADGRDFTTINGRGYVPALELDSGEYLTEGPAIVQFIADRAPAKKLAPEPGSLQRYRLAEWLNFITSELHKGYSPLFSPTTPDAYKPLVLDRLATRYEWVDAQLAKGGPYVLGETFSVADAYLFTVTRWAPNVKLDLARFERLSAHQRRIDERPHVQAALAAEGLAKK